MNERLLVTGGAGYIGSHVLVELVHAGYRPVVLDSLENGSREAVMRVQAMTGVTIPLIEGDIRDSALLARLFASYRRSGDAVEAVLHLAGCKAVGESVRLPLKYYANNMAGTATLLQAMLDAGVDRIVFSSSATVYGAPINLPLDESHPLCPANPYGRTKLMVEQMLHDVCASRPSFGATVLRYFNPIGAHASGLIGEHPQDEPNNLFPYITQVASGTRPTLTVFGDDFDTADGTGVRDYLHVMDLADAHRRALDFVMRTPGWLAVNLGTGAGTSVLELVSAFVQATGRAVPFRVAGRRAGDVARMWAQPRRARELLGWQATRGLADMCADGWRWQSLNPHGYARHAASHDLRGMREAA